MYYSEKVIKGVLHYQKSPYDGWRKMSKKQLTSRVVILQEDLAKARKKHSKVLDNIEKLKS